MFESKALFSYSTLLSMTMSAAVAGTFLRSAFANRWLRPGATSKKSPPRRLRSRKRSVPNLLLFVHPRCQQTLATIRQLRNLLLRTERYVSLRMIVWCPEGTGEEWYETVLIQEARRIEGLEIVLDYGGSLSRRYGADTSGTVLAYNEKSTLKYQGGITPAAGHEGDCAGRQAIERVLKSETPTFSSAPVYGGKLFEQSPLEWSERDSQNQR